MNFIKKHWGNIIFFGLIIFMLTPSGMPLRALLIKGVSYLTSRVENLEIDPEKRQTLQDYDWQLISTDGKSIDLKESKSKVILLNNWATWCPPCVAEMPSLNDLYTQNNYADKVVFIFVAHDQNIEKVHQFIKNNNLKVPVFFMRSNPPEMLNSSTIPTTFIINKKGEIVVQKTGAADWNSGQVHKILDKLIDE